MSCRRGEPLRYTEAQSHCCYQQANFSAQIYTARVGQQEIFISEIVIFSLMFCCLITRLLSLLYSYLSIVFYFRLELSSPGVMWCYIEGRTWTERKTSCSGVCIVKVLHRGRPGVGWPSQRGPSPSSTPWSSFHTILVICRVGQVKPITIRYLERPGTPLDSDWQCCWVGLKIVINILLSLL